MLIAIWLRNRTACYMIRMIENCWSFIHSIIGGTIPINLCQQNKSQISQGCWIYFVCNENTALRQNFGGHSMCVLMSVSVSLCVCLGLDFVYICSFLVSHCQRLSLSSSLAVCLWSSVSIWVCGMVLWAFHCVVVVVVTVSSLVQKNSVGCNTFCWHMDGVCCVWQYQQRTDTHKESSKLRNIENAVHLKPWNWWYCRFFESAAEFAGWH